MSCKIYLAAVAMLATAACETLDKQTGSVDRLVDEAPLVKITFVGDAAPLNGPG